jgi:hypothetical protein
MLGLFAPDRCTLFIMDAIYFILICTYSLCLNDLHWQIFEFKTDTSHMTASQIGGKLDNV